MYDRGEIMTEEERISILEWLKVVEHSERFFRSPINRGEYTLFLDDPDVPIAIWKIKRRLIEREGLYKYRQDPLYGKNNNRSNDFVTFIYNNGILQPHTDLNGIDGTIHCRFNVFLQVSSGCDTYYGGYLIEGNNRGYVMCRSGADTHWTTLNTGDARIALSFGYLLPRAKMDELYKIPQNRKKVEIPSMPFFLTIYFYFHMLYRVWRVGS